MKSMYCKYKIQLTETLIHHSLCDWVVQTQWLHTQSTSGRLIHHCYKTMEAACKAVKGGRNSNSGGNVAIRDCVFRWTIREWGENNLVNGGSLINIPELTTEAVNLVYTAEEVEAQKASIRA